MKNKFSFYNCEGEVEHINEVDVVVNAHIKEPISSKYVSYIAATPPNFRASFTGSALPFHTQRQAFDGTPNSGTAMLGSGNTFTVKLKYPNSYYTGLGTIIIPPTLYVFYSTVDGDSRIVKIPISRGIPFRLLTYPMQFTRARKDATFYEGGWEMPVRSQEQILRDSAYPSVNSMPENFWGKRPPV